jgi:hypothetical protein
LKNFYIAHSNKPSRVHFQITLLAMIVVSVHQDVPYTDEKCGLGFGPHGGPYELMTDN